MTPDRIKEEIGFFKTMFIVAAAMCAPLTGYVAFNYKMIAVINILAFILLLAFCIILGYSYSRMRVLIKKL